MNKKSFKPFILYWGKKHFKERGRGRGNDRR